MGRIKGHYEWDDDDLTPGRKKEGGLHQNLFDSKGNLRGSARFVPAAEGEEEPLIVTETVYVPVEERRKAQDVEELVRAITELLELIYVGVEKAPVVAKWWRERARPTVDAKRAQVRQRLSRSKAPSGEAVVAGTVVESSHELSEAEEPESRPDMSSAEAKARYLAALAARAFSDEQMRLVAGANIVDGEDLAQLQRSLAELPPDQVRGLIEAMVTNPTLLGEDALAHLASLLGRRELS